MLEDRHLLFDIILDEQLLDCAANYDTLILPNVKRLSPEEGAHLKQFVEKGGKLIFTGDTGKYQLDGRSHPEGLLADWGMRADESRERTTPEGVCYIPSGEWEPNLVEVRADVQLQVYPSLENDSFGQDFLRDLEALLEELYLETDAPWFVRVRAWLPEGQEALTLHWVNYKQDEEADIETPQPVGPVQVECKVPEDYAVQKVEWLYPEKGDPVVLPHETLGERIRFTIPSVIVYGLSVLYLQRV